MTVEASHPDSDRPVVVYVDVVGDLLHYGHVRFFKHARELGTELVVGVCSDSLTESYKRRPVMRLDERVEMISACRWVDKVIRDAPSPLTEEFILEHGIDLVVHGDDFDDATVDYWYGAAVRMGRYRSVPYTTTISTSDIIQRIVDRHCAGDF